MSSQQHLSKALHSAGFDIAHPFPVDALSESSMEMLSGIFKAKIPRCGVLIGNTSLVWSAFVLWLKQQPQWHQLNHPLNTFVEEHIQAHCRTCLPSAHILWTHQTGSYVVPIQRIAHESGFAFLSRGQFNVHPQYGPWFALRALLLVDEEPPAPKASVDPSASKTELKAHRMFQQLCAHRVGDLSHSDIQSHWRNWLRLRDVYDVGKSYRYTDAQIRYHYTHDKCVLKREIEACG